MCELGHDPCGGSEVILKQDILLLKRAGVPTRIYAHAARAGSPVSTLPMRTNLPLASSLEYCGRFLLSEHRGLLLGCNEPTLVALAPNRSIVRFDFTTPLPRYYRLPFWLGRFQRGTYLFPSKNEKRIFHEQHPLIPDQRSHVVPYAIDTEIFRPVRQGEPSGQRVGFAGQFVHIKGIRVLLDAWKSVKSKLPAPELRLAGGPGLWKNASGIDSDCADLGQRVAEMAAAGMLMTVGELKRTEMPAFWNTITVAVVPSLCEAFGLVALEALACGVPVIASDVGGLPEIVENGKSGILVPPNDPKALADALITLLTDEPLRRQLASGARQRAEQFSLATRSASLIKLFQQQIGQRGNGHSRI